MARPARPARPSIAERRAQRAAIDDPAEVLAAAARYLEVRPRATAEIRVHLRQAGYRGDLVESAIVRLAELGYLDDAAFARAWVESRDRARPRGARALRHELRRKGVTADDAEAALAARAAEAAGGDPDDPDLRPESGQQVASGIADEAAATRLLDRKATALLREPDPRRRRGRAYAVLARNGFDPGIAGRVASSWVARATGGGQDEPPGEDESP